METAGLKPGYGLCNVAPVHDVAARLTSAEDGALLGKVFMFVKQN